MFEPDALNFQTEGFSNMRKMFHIYMSLHAYSIRQGMF